MEFVAPEYAHYTTPANRLSTVPEPVTIRQLHYFFVLLVSHQFKDCESKQTRSHQNRGQANMARRQTETTYLKEALLWLRRYWTD
jgi:hypothetical protein